MIEAIRQIYWNVGEVLGSLTVYVSALAAMLVLFYGIVRDVATWRKGRPDARLDAIGDRASEFVVQTLGQKKTLQDRKPGMMHALIFFGFLGLFIGTDVIAVEEDFTIPLLGPDAGKILVGDYYRAYETILDAIGLAFVGGLIWAYWRRYHQREERLHERQYDREALIALIFVGISGYVIEGLRLANQEISGVPVFEQSWAIQSFVGYGLAVVMRAVGLGSGSEIGLGLHLVLWITHTVVSMAFLAAIPFTGLRHLVYTPLNSFFKRTRPRGALAPIADFDAEIEKDEPKLGVATINDLTWKQRLDLDACMSCGRCQSVCPAHASGSNLSPKFLITKMADLQRGHAVTMKDGSVKTAEAETSGRGAFDAISLLEQGFYDENELWSCTTCGACVEECPAMIDHVDLIVDFRRNLTMIQSEVPSGVKRVLDGIERANNPWRLPQRERANWASGLDIPTMSDKGEADVLFWVGCAPSYDDRSKKTARAMAQLLKQADVDFAILGGEECCTGDPARRMGEELLFKQQAETNVQTLGQYKFKTLVTTCAHCYNSHQNEYVQFGGRAGIDYQVVHHTDYLAQLVRDQKLQPVNEVNQKVAYHDPCYIGRYNDIVDSPRELLQSIPGIELVEAPEYNRQRAMCCGGGGGNAWLEGWGDKKTNVIRLEQLRTENPDTIAVACPYCMVMFEDAAKNTGVDDKVARQDVAELLLQSVKTE
ncbi:MAG: (Fe-S)-binding protein [Chloroflexota bacterium]|jgi:Fe-S oxidoreductase/nitrate reductase gamma subunit